jgi:hypothetical protein
MSFASPGEFDLPNILVVDDLDFEIPLKLHKVVRRERVGEGVKPCRWRPRGKDAGASISNRSTCKASRSQSRWVIGGRCR